ncbi:MAG: DUF2268 domain-containing putative Zn-dependent protease [Candidatus Woesearchaeota archaeon]
MTQTNKTAKLIIKCYLAEPHSDYLETTTNKIQEEREIGYAGFRSRSDLAQWLGFWLNGESLTKYHAPDEKEVKVCIKKAFERCNKLITSEVIHVFVFSTSSSFVTKYMNGVSGYTPWKSTILVALNAVPSWQYVLTATIAHETVHAIALNKLKRTTLLDDFVAEGMAEAFREHILKDGQSVFSKAVSKTKSKKIFSNVKNSLAEPSDNIYGEIFFGTGKYPLWAGYSIGYYIVKDFLKNTGMSNWRKIIMTPPEKVLELSKWSESIL